MSDSDFTAFIREVREAIQEIKQDVRRIEVDLYESKIRTNKRRWWHL